MIESENPMDHLTSKTTIVAETVDRYLRVRKLHSPGIQTLQTILDVLFCTSLKTDELRSLACSVTYLDPAKPDPQPPQRIRDDRWGYSRFDHPITLTVANLTKICRAVDPRVASLAVHADARGTLRIWGIIDQLPLHYARFVTWEADSGPEVPGLFHATIAGIGEISVFREYELIVSLRQEQVLRGQQAVLWSGPVHERLTEYIGGYLQEVRGSLGRDPKRIDDWQGFLARTWLGTLCRVLLRISEYRHGGAILIQPQHSLTDLKISYPIKYSRLADSLVKYAVNSCLYYESFSGVLDAASKPSESGAELLDLYSERSAAQVGKHDCQGALAGSVGLVASLSCVDGLVLMDRRLVVRGFGVEITDRSAADSVYIARSANAIKGLRRKDTKLYGTRHRSMMRYCANHPGSIGFVISQDGPVRAITKVGQKLVMWEDIQLRLAFASID